jgi:excinuclease ABC A subunit
MSAREKEIGLPERDKIVIRGARVHNLKNIDVEIPRNKLVVITGLSGSGKSSLAFDTIYAEGQRRYVESLSAYARQFLGIADKPDVDYIEGLSPAISIDQKAGSRNPRSTVGTVTEIYDYLRLLFARIGKPHCPQCGRPVQQQTVSQMVDQIMDYPEGTKIQIMAPIVRGKKGEHQRIFKDLQKKGFVRVRVNGEIRELDEDITLERYKKHDIDVVVDRLVIRPGLENRLADSLETALGLGEGIAVAVLALFVVIMLSGSYLKQSHGEDDDVSGKLVLVKKAVKKADWESAQKEIDNLEEAWEKIVPRVQFSMERNEIKHLSVSLTRARAAITAKDKAGALMELEEADYHWNSLGE